MTFVLLVGVIAAALILLAGVIVAGVDLDLCESSVARRRAVVVEAAAGFRRLLSFSLEVESCEVLASEEDTTVAVVGACFL